MGGARERAHPRLCKFFNVQTIFKHVSMYLVRVLMHPPPCSASVYNNAMCMYSVAMYISHVA